MCNETFISSWYFFNNIRWRRAHDTGPSRENEYIRLLNTSSIRSGKHFKILVKNTLEVIDNRTHYRLEATLEDDGPCRPNSDIPIISWPACKLEFLKRKENSESADETKFFALALEEKYEEAIAFANKMEDQQLGANIILDLLKYCDELNIDVNKLNNVLNQKPLQQINNSGNNVNATLPLSLEFIWMASPTYWSGEIDAIDIYIEKERRYTVLIPEGDHRGNRVLSLPFMKPDNLHSDAKPNFLSIKNLNTAHKISLKARVLKEKQGNTMMRSFDGRWGRDTYLVRDEVIIDVLNLKLLELGKHYKIIVTHTMERVGPSGKVTV